MNPHLAEPPVLAGAPLAEAGLAALVVHGRGQTPGYMLDVLKRLDVPGIACVLPRAAGQTWYPERFTAPVERNQPWLDHALDACGEYLDRIHREGHAPERTILLGFSQGACLLSEYLVRNPRRYAGAALLTGGYLGPLGEPRTAAGDFAGTPVFLGGSRYDDWVPVTRMQETATLLGDMGADVTVEIYDDREHFVNDRAAAGTQKLIEAALAA